MRSTFWYAILCVVAAGSFFCGTANADETAAIAGEQAANTGEHRHDGFFLRLAPGIGVMSTSEKLGADKYEYSGASGLFNFAVGGAIFENVILHLDITGASMSEPKLKVNGQSKTTTTNDHATSLLGIGLTYYFPSNFYLTGAAGIAKTELKANGNTYRTDDGFGFNLMLGKEWWVSENWGLGVAGQWLYTDCPDKPYAGSTPHVKASAIGVLFSATYN